MELASHRGGPVKYVNLGCGNRYHTAWINFDIVASGPEVIAHDLRHGIPLPSDTCDVVYHSHVLEHLRRAEALSFMSECCRVLKPGGVLRVAVPDLEQICRAYLEKLEAAVSRPEETCDDYDWMMLELYDQTVREKPGGEMRAFLARSPLPSEPFVYGRIGEEARAIAAPAQQHSPAAKSGWARVRNSIGYRFGALMDRFAKKTVRLTRGKQAEHALGIGLFRLAGEGHQWMYDRFSLARLMRDVGLQNPVRKSAAESQIANWCSFNLDTLSDGTVIKPDSLFMEAIKPGR
jgi:hypothetical protein